MRTYKPLKPRNHLRLHRGNKVTTSFQDGKLLQFERTQNGADVEQYDAGIRPLMPGVGLHFNDPPRDLNIELLPNGVLRIEIPNFAQSVETAVDPTIERKIQQTAIDAKAYIDKTSSPREPTVLEWCFTVRVVTKHDPKNGGEYAHHYYDETAAMTFLKRAAGQGIFENFFANQAGRVAAFREWLTAQADFKPYGQRAMKIRGDYDDAVEAKLHPTPPTPAIEPEPAIEPAAVTPDQSAEEERTAAYEKWMTEKKAEKKAKKAKKGK